MTVRGLGDVIIYLGAVAGALTAVGVLARWCVVRPLKRWLAAEVGAPLQQARQVAEDTHSKTTAIEAEVSHNHGTSLKDAVTRTEQKVDTLSARFDDHLRTHHER
ncbi:hypothetical protein OG417_07860 [Actinoallomurus sp. NBC_01490]|jgi:hypothetical protein|uniref:hypothetical protein n=1 Tax=Actinoallomurus sp. NBC_01490 TaxID=2903557 RepID=UPI002E34C9E9|nr:hypothetical protein [Actinoallomurus sp. NBC_01490]